MTADRAAPRPKLLEADLTDRILGAFYRVCKDVVHGHFENVYANSLKVELDLRRIPWESEVMLPVFYRGVRVGLYRCDLLVDRRVIVEVKAQEMITSADKRQLRNYLSCANVEVGLILNFGVRPTFERIVVSRHRPAKRLDPPSSA